MRGSYNTGAAANLNKFNVTDASTNASSAHGDVIDYIIGENQLVSGTARGRW